MDNHTFTDKGETMKKDLVESTIDQLIQLGVLEKVTDGIKKTDDFQIRVEGCLTKLHNRQDYFKHLKDFFPKEDLKQLINRFVDQAELLVVLDMMGKKGKTVEIERCSEVLMNIRELQLNVSVVEK